jgi:peptidoglycan/LPS O-acetylase OafA/YrhL
VRSVRLKFILIFGVLAVGTGLLVLDFAHAYEANRALTFEFKNATAKEPGVAETYLSEYAGGFFKQEANDAFGYRWTKPQLNLQFDYLPPRDHILRLEMLGAPGQKEPVTLYSVRPNWRGVVERKVMATFSASEGLPKIYEFNVPAYLQANGSVRLELVAPAFRPPGDERGELGVVVTRLELVRTDDGLLIGTGLLSGLALAVMLAWMIYFGCTLRWTKEKQFAGHLILAGALLISGFWLSREFYRQPLSLPLYLHETHYTLARVAIFVYTFQGLLAVLRLFLRWQAARYVTPTPDSGVAKPANLPALTGLRYIAALVVLFYHLPMEPDWAEEIYHIFRSGNNGVSFFYTLSGFVLCYNYFYPLVGRFRQNLLPFWLARVARIYPMYILAFGLSLLIMPDRFKTGWLNGILHAFALQTFTPAAATDFNNPAWSVSVEFFFYAVFPFVLVFGLRFLRRPLALIMAIGAVWAAQMAFLTYGFPSGFQPDDSLFAPYRVGEFVTGILLGQLFLSLKASGNVPSRREQSVMTGLTLAGLIAVVVIMSLDRDVLAPYRYGVIYTPAFCLIIWWVARYNPNWKTFLGRPEWVLLGEVSYGFYLLHVMVIEVMTNHFGALRGGFADYVMFAAIMAVTTLLALLGYHYFETPSRRFLRRLFRVKSAPKIEKEEVSSIPATPAPAR